MAPDVIPSTTKPAGPSRGRHWLVVGIFVLAFITGFAAIHATWVKRQALDTHHWTNTSTKLLANKNIDNALGAYLTAQLFSNVDVASQLRGALPKQAQALAAPVAAGLHELASKAAPELLARPAVQQAWRKSNELAHKQLLAVLKGGGNTVSTKNGEVVLNLHSLVDQLASTLGVEKQVAAARSKLNGGLGAAAQERLNIPASTGKLVILRSNQLKSAQDTVEAIKGASILLTIISLGLFALAVVLSGGARRTALRTVGWSFVGLGLLTLLTRRIAGNQLVDSLVKVESNKPAVHDAWAISTSLLYGIAISMVVYGLVVIVAAWVAGPTRLAVAARRAVAAPLRERPALVYLDVAALYLLVLVWGPTPAFRNLLPVLLIAALLVLGIEVVRRQAAREFPDAARGDAMRSLRAWRAPTAAAAHVGNGDRVGLD